MIWCYFPSILIKETSNHNDLYWLLHEYILSSCCWDNNCWRICEKEVNGQHLYKSMTFHSCLHLTQSFSFHTCNTLIKTLHSTIAWHISPSSNIGRLCCSVPSTFSYFLQLDICVNQEEARMYCNHRLHTGSICRLNQYFHSQVLWGWVTLIKL